MDLIAPKERSNASNEFNCAVLFANAVIVCGWVSEGLLRKSCLLSSGSLEYINHNNTMCCNQIAINSKSLSQN